jgi:flagellar protein FliS
MTASARQDEYFASQVLTASPHKLHLLLVEGAIRFGRQAEAAMGRGDFESASAPLVRMLDVVGEMLASVRQLKSDLNRKIAELYLFLFRRVSEAKVNDDVEKLVEALRLLDYERETWRLVCAKLATDHTGHASTADNRSGDKPPRAPLRSNGTATWPSSSAFGLSLEA